MRVAQQIVDALDRGSTTQSYKYVTWLALIDVITRQTEATGPPATINGEDVADEVLAIYWRQTRPYHGQLLTHTRQRGLSLLEHAAKVQRLHGLSWHHDVGVLFETTQGAARRALVALRTRFRNTICGQPLPRMQTVAGNHNPFLFDVWSAHPQGQKTGWDGVPGRDGRCLPLHRDAALGVIDTHKLLIPLIRSALLSFVVAKSPLTPDEALVEHVLFDPDRVALNRVRDDLVALHGGTCFYCEGPLSNATQVDHFLPWSRTRDDGIDNLVPAHSECNRSKSQLLAHVRHLRRWVTRHQVDGLALKEIAAVRRWPHHPSHTLGHARTLYSALGAAESPTWQLRGLPTTPLVIADADAVLAGQVWSQ